jgi:DNA-binding CsgD family transcriptional regulator
MEPETRYAKSGGLRIAYQVTGAGPDLVMVPWEALTDAERRVAHLVAAGLANREVAERLFLSRYTVETHLKHVFAKLGVSSRAELAALAPRNT